MMRHAVVVVALAGAALVSVTVHAQNFKVQKFNIKGDGFVVISH